MLAVEAFGDGLNAELVADVVERTGEQLAPRDTEQRVAGFGHAHTQRHHLQQVGLRQLTIGVVIVARLPIWESNL